MNKTEQHCKVKDRISPLSNDGAGSTIKPIHSYDLSNKSILLHADYNTKCTKKPILKILKSIKTIKNILKYKNVELVICSHYGRPSGNKQDMEAYDLSCQFEYLSAFFPNLKKITIDDVNSTDNIRFYTNSELQEFGDKFDYIVLDAFGCAHRDIPWRRNSTRPESFIKECSNHPIFCFGDLMLEELGKIDILKQQFADKKNILLLGGAKCKDKIKLIQSYKGTVFTSGLIACSFLKYLGYEIGQTKCFDWSNEDLITDSNTQSDSIRAYDDITFSHTFQSNYLSKKHSIIIPYDFTVTSGDHKNGRKVERVVVFDSIGPGDTVIDIGQKTLGHLSSILNVADSVVMNGPFGLIEGRENNRTKEFFQKCPKTIKHKMVIGGGETADCAIETCLKGDQINEKEFPDNYMHISTGGGSLLTMLVDREMPGIQ